MAKETMNMAWKQVQRQQQHQAQAQAQAQQSQEIQTEAQTDSQADADSQPEQPAQPESVAQQQVAAQPDKPVNPINPVVPDLDALLSAATPAQLAKIRALAIGKGIAVASSASNRLPDGSMMVSVRLDAPVAEQLEIWAEADGLSLIDEAQKRIVEALENYLYGDWNPVPAPEPVVVAAK
jgi:hypothetical protein